MSKTRSEYIALAKKQVGITSGDKYRSWYNNAVGNIGNSKWAYCAAGLAWTAAQTGLTSSEFPYTASAPTMLNWYKSKNRFYARGTYIPNPGDTIIFKWADNYESTASHVGAVDYVSGNYVYTVEFNSTGGNVCAKCWSLSNTAIVGYGVPFFNEKNTSNVSSSKDNKSEIKQVQSWLNNTYHTHCVIDGEYGKETKSALVGALQCYLNTTYGAGLEIDGIFGSKTKSAVPNVSKGAKGNLVYILQGALICNGYETGGFDGEFGSVTYNSVVKYQTAHKLEIDGIAGKETFAALLA